MSTVTWFHTRSRALRYRAGHATAIREPELRRGEHVLVREDLPLGGGAVTVTNSALHIRHGSQADGLWERVEWSRVHTVVRSKRPGLLQVMRIRLRPPTDAVVHALVLRENSRIPDIACELAASAIVMVRQVVTRDDRVVTFVAHREPGSNAVSWTVEFSPGADRADTSLLAEVDQTLREIRSQAGC